MFPFCEGSGEDPTSALKASLDKAFPPFYSSTGFIESFHLGPRIQRLTYSFSHGTGIEIRVAGLNGAARGWLIEVEQARTATLLYRSEIA
jgi:hypothetical protein